MNKKELIEKIAEEQNLTKVEASKMVEAVFDTISSELKEGRDVKIVGFGSFCVKQKKQRKTVIPKTGQKVLIPSYKAASFQASQVLKDLVK